MQKLGRWALNGSGIMSRGVRCLFAAIFTFAAVAALCQTTAETWSPIDPLPQDSGAAGLRQMLRRLNTTARLMHTTAHPDDEDGGMLTWNRGGTA